MGEGWGGWDKTNKKGLPAWAALCYFRLYAFTSAKLHQHPNAHILGPNNKDKANKDEANKRESCGKWMHNFLTSFLYWAVFYRTNGSLSSIRIHSFCLLTEFLQKDGKYRGEMIPSRGLYDSISLDEEKLFNGSK